MVFDGHSFLRLAHNSGPRSELRLSHARKLTALPLKLPDETTHSHRDKQKAPRFYPRGFLCVCRGSVDSGASHGVAAVKALVAGAVAHGNRPAGVARGRILHEVLDGPVESLHGGQCAVVPRRPGRCFLSLCEFNDGFVDNSFLLFLNLFEWQFGLPGVR